MWVVVSPTTVAVAAARTEQQGKALGDTAQTLFKRSFSLFRTRWTCSCCDFAYSVESATISSFVVECAVVLLLVVTLLPLSDVT